MMRAMKIKNIIVLISLVMVFARPQPTLGAGDIYDHDTRLWSGLTWRQFKRGKWRGDFHGELRWFSNITRVGAYVLQQKVHYQLGPKTILGVGPSFINLEKEKAPDNNKIRAEFQLTQSLWSNQVVNFSTRNRLELRWWQNNNRETEPMTRHQLKLEVKTSLLPSLVKYSLSNEFFYDWYRSDFNENRFFPVNLHFNFIESGLSSVIYLQVRSRKFLKTWQEAYILGVSLIY
jgi:hypothetical protein